MGGFEATKKIREMESKTGIRTPIIAITAHAIQGYREKCLDGGMDGYISKPVHIEALKQTLEEFVPQDRNKHKRKKSQLGQETSQTPLLDKPALEGNTLLCNGLDSPMLSKSGLESPMLSKMVPDNLKVRILLAEDNAVNQKVAIRLLEKFGYSVVLAENGLIAVKMAEQQTFDLILMDVQMPEMGGFEATAKIREFEANLGRHTPIVAMTAHAIQGYSDKCLEGGMDGYISKPIHAATLKQAIEGFLIPS